ncbi:hypothetical protein Vretimale_4920 [Volvox reticuliferus]|uniref:Uncharacterized protein n=1 Tax=Volvox reticuliferus TaxID=1737510 RepID=A0A8J4DHY1_9CHLO|nr:hypothetical protein Vretifemale_4186 [Volvox reticuliferus]GIL99868.1 hypothetical protein Vretimale_4920 [Volvox reticuliferus]
MSSSSSNKNQTQAKYANSNLNAVFAKPTASAAAQSSTSGTINRNGMLVLSKRTARAVSGAKVVVPKPVNLPSLKKEHAGNDPSTQLVPAGASAGWAKPEEQAPPTQPQEVRSALTAGSNWASQPRIGSGAWASTGTSSPAHGRGPSFPVDRHLNPDEYPSLAATARSNSQPQKQRPVPYEQPQDPRGWADDERAPAGGLRHGDWDDERGRDWDRSSRDARFEPYGVPRPGHFDDYDEHPRGGRPYDSFGPSSRTAMYDYPPPPPPRRPTYERDTYERYDRPAERYDRPAERYERPAERYERPGYATNRFTDYDDSLIPPPPPPRLPSRDAPQIPPSVPPPEEEDEDPERAAFEAELRNLQAEIGKKKAEQKDISSSRASAPAPEPQMEQPGNPEDTVPKQTEIVTAPSKAPVIATKLVARDAEEEERRRKQAAAEKLRALEESIAARNAAAVKPTEVEMEAKLPTRPDAPADGARIASKAIDISEPRTNAWGPVPKPPTTAMFGSFDEHLLEELHRTPAPQPQLTQGTPAHSQQQQHGTGLPGQQQFHQQHQAYSQQFTAPPPAAQAQHTYGQHPPHAYLQQHAAGPQQPAPVALAQSASPDEQTRTKPWRPVEGTTPVLLTHASAPSLTSQQGASAPKDAAPAPVYDPNSYDRRALPPSGRGRGRGEPGRGRGRSGGSGYDSPEGGEASGSDAPVEGGRGRGRGRGAAERGRGGRGGRGARGRGRGDDSGAEEEAAVSGAEAGEGEQNGRRNGSAFSVRQVDALVASSGDRSSGRGQGQRREGRGGRSAGSHAADGSQSSIVMDGMHLPSAVASGDMRATGQDRATLVIGRTPPQSNVSVPPSQSQPLPQAQLQQGQHIQQQVPASGAAMGLAAAAAAASNASDPNSNSLAWGSNIATDVAVRTLEDPVVPDLNLPVTLDPTPAMKPPGSLVGLGPQAFDRSIGPKPAQQQAAQPVVMAKVGIPGSQVQPTHSASGPTQHVHQQAQHSAHAHQDISSKSVEVLDSGMPALPADLNLDILPAKPTGVASGLGGFAAGANGGIQSQDARGALSGGYGAFGAGTGEHGSSGTSGGQGPAPAGISVWSRPNTLGAFGQTSSGLQAHQPGTAGFSAGLTFYNTANPGFPNTGAMGTNAAGNSGTSAGAGQPSPQLMLNIGQGAFAPGPFAVPFSPPVRPFPPMPHGGQFSGLNTNIFLQQPFLPTDKQPDWSMTGLGGQNTNLTPAALPRPVDLGIPPPPFVVQQTGTGSQAGATASGTATGGADGNATATGTFGALPNALLGAGLPSLSPAGFTSGHKQPGALGHPGLKPAVQGGYGTVQQAAAQQLPQQPSIGAGGKEAVKPNLPDDIFDVKPSGQLQQQQQPQSSTRLPSASMPPPVPPASGPARLGHGAAAGLPLSGMPQSPANIVSGVPPGSGSSVVKPAHAQGPTVAPVSQSLGPVPGSGAAGGGRGGRGRGDGRGGPRATTVEGGRGRGFAGRGGRGGMKSDGDTGGSSASGAVPVGPSPGAMLAAGVGTSVSSVQTVQAHLAIPSSVGPSQGGQAGGPSGQHHGGSGGRGEGGRGGRGRGGGGRGRGVRGEGGQPAGGRGSGQSGRGGKGGPGGGTAEGEKS